MAEDDDAKKDDDDSGQTLISALPPSAFKAGWLKIKSDWPIFTATLLLAIATFGLWHATVDLVHDAKHTADRQLRAYVFLRDVRLQKRNDDNYDIIPEWENAGATETVGLTAYLNRALTDIALPEWFGYGDINPGVGNVPIILGPKSTSNLSFDTIAKKCLVQFNNRTDVSKFYLWGWAKYNDTETSDEHITRFCWDIDQAIFSSDGSTVRLSHKYCPRANCADKQCPDPGRGMYQLRGFTCKDEVIPAATGPNQTPAPAVSPSPTASPSPTKSPSKKPG